MSKLTLKMIACCSLDGKIARFANEPPNQRRLGGWTSAEDKEVFDEALGWADCYVIGGRTLNAMGPNFAMKKLTGHITVVARNKQNYVSLSPARRITIVPFDLMFILRYLEERMTMYEECKVLVCGGAATYRLMLPVLDKITLVTEPVVFTQGVPLFSDWHGTTEDERRFVLSSVTQLNVEGTMRSDYVSVRPNH